ncbi:hypothetical protein ACA910_005860 [Epithemia clementina (nom. ined.)]
MTSLRLALKQSLEESSGGFSPPSDTNNNNSNHHHHHHNATLLNNHNANSTSAPPPSPGGSVHRTAVASPTSAAAMGPLSAPASLSNTTFSNSLNNSHHHPSHSNSHSPQPWKKRGPGRPRKNNHTADSSGTGKKRGRPRKHPVSEEQEGQDDPSSSENEFSGDEEIEEAEEEQQQPPPPKDVADELKQSKLPKKKKLVHATGSGGSGKETQSEPPGERAESKPTVSRTKVDCVARRELKTSSREASATTTGTRDKESDEGKPTKGKAVPAPLPRVLAWTRNLPVKEARQNVKQGIRVKVRFSTKLKKEGKRKKKWYGGLVSQVSKAGSKIRIKYDDGTSEVSRFPDKDVVVDATLNGEHQCSSEFFDPPPEDDEERMNEDGTEMPMEKQKQEPEPNQPKQQQPLPPSTQSQNQEGTAELTAAISSGERPETTGTKQTSMDTKTPTTEAPDAAKEKVAKRISDPDAQSMEAAKSSSEQTGSSKAEELSKPKRKRGRPPKVRPPTIETSASNEESPPDQKKSNDKHSQAPQPTVSPLPTAAESPDPLVDTPVHQPHHRPTLEINSDSMEDGNAVKFSSEAASLHVAEADEDDKPTPRLLSIRIPKLKASGEAGVGVTAKPIATKPDKSPRPISSGDVKKDQEPHTASKRIHIHLTVPKAATGKDSKGHNESNDNQNQSTKGRTTPVPGAAQKYQDDELRTPASPRSKKIKRKREFSPNNPRSRSPRPPFEEPGDKFASVNSAFEKSSAGSLNHAQQQIDEDDDSKTLTPRGRPGKVDAARSGRRNAAKEANDRMSSKPEEQVVSKKKKKRDRRRDVEGGEESDHEESLQSSPPWVQCDKCKKWRIIPSEAVGSLPERWFCENNVWDPKRANCDAPQQKDKQLVRERKRRKRQRLMEKAAASAENRTASDNQADAVSDESNEHENSATSRSQDEVDEGIKRPRRASPTENSDSSVNNDPKGEKKTLPKKLRSHADSIEVHEDENAADLKPRGRGRPRRNMVNKEANAHANTEQTPDEAENLEWVQCEKCDKWRKLPPEISADELPEVWYCAMNTWNPASASCSAPEDKAEAGLTDIFNNGGAGAGKLSYRNLIFGNGRKFNRPISERTRAAESLFAAVSDDTDAPPAVTYANSSAFISRSKLNQPEETEGLSVLELMSRSHLWKELHAISAQLNGGLCPFDRLSHDIKESLKDLILHSLGSRTMSGEEVANDIQHRNWQNVPLGWAAAQPHCSVNTIIMTMCELVREGVLECMKDFEGGNRNNPDSYILTYRRAKSYSQATLKHLPLGEEEEDGGGPSRCMKFAKPWKSNESGEEQEG